MMKKPLYALASAMILMGCNMDKGTIHTEIGMSVEEFNKQDAVGTILYPLGGVRPSSTASDKPHDVVYTFNDKSITINGGESEDVDQVNIASSRADHRSMDLLERSEIEHISVIIGRNKIGPNIFSRQYIDLDSVLAISNDLCEKFRGLGFTGKDGQELRSFKIFGKSTAIIEHTKRNIPNLEKLREAILDEDIGGVVFSFCRGVVKSESVDISLLITIQDVQREFAHLNLIDESEEKKYKIHMYINKDDSDLIEEIQQEIKRRKQADKK